MSDDVIKQVRALRDNLADELSRDPRVLTLQSLDKTLAELDTIRGPAAAPAPAAQATSLVARLNAMSPARATPATSSASHHIAKVA